MSLGLLLLLLLLFFNQVHLSVTSFSCLSRLDYYHSGFQCYYSFLRWFFVWNISWEFCPSLSGFISYLLIAWAHPFLLLYFSISNCVLLEDFFLVSHLTIFCVKWYLCCLRVLFIYLFFLQPVSTDLLQCQHWNLFFCHLLWQLHWGFGFFFLFACLDL